MNDLQNFTLELSVTSIKMNKLNQVIDLFGLHTHISSSMQSILVVWVLVSGYSWASFLIQLRCILACDVLVKAISNIFSMLHVCVHDSMY